MHLIEKPSVYVLGRLELNNDDLARFLQDHGISWSTDSSIGSEVLVETAGRVCYMSFAKPRPGGNAAYIGHIKEVGHGSVLEHAVWNLLFTGISRSLTHELVRHRAGWGYSQLSQRYVDESVAEFVIPPEILADVQAAQQYLMDTHQTLYEALHTHHDHNSGQRAPNETEELGLIFLEASEHSHEAYVKISDRLTKRLKDRDDLDNTTKRKIARQTARSVLPNATETKIFCTGNARAYRHFIEMRASRHADAEIRGLAIAVLDCLQKESPNLFGDYEKVLLPDGTYEAQTKFRKI